MYVDNEYTAKKLMRASKKLGFNMIYQWVKKNKKMVVACDFFAKN
jgi:hypothetical protein